MKLTDAQASEIKQGLAIGMRGPILLKWCEQLLADRDVIHSNRNPIA